MNLRSIKDIKKIIKEKAKYQKVMLIFDDTVTNSQIAEIYSEIKPLCVFNKMSTSEFDVAEINNGYRAIIFVCCSDNFLKLKYSKSDFVNIYFPTDQSLLPYYLTEFESCGGDDYLILNEVVLDVGAVTSVYFARFYNYLHDLLCEQSSNMEFDFSPFDITQKNILKMLEELNPMQFEDVKILSEMGLEYSNLPLVDFVLISAFQVLIGSIKQGLFNLVDVYKVAKDNIGMIDKFFALSNNNLLSNLISLNFNRLNLACEKSKTTILNLLPSEISTKSNVERVIDKIKRYCANANGLMGYLYLYNIFGV